MMTSYSCFQFFRLVSSCFSRNKQRQVPQKTPQLFQSNGPVRPGQWNTCAFTLRFYLQQRQNLPEINKKCRGSMPQAVSLLQGKRKRAFQLNSLEHSFLSYGDTILQTKRCQTALRIVLTIDMLYGVIIPCRVNMHFNTVN